MKTLKKAILILLCASIALSTMAAISGPSLAITGNSQPSSTPYVGVVVLFSDAERTQPISYSTGVLISENVVLTAGHSLVGGVAASVSFDQGPIIPQIDQTGKISYKTNQPIYNAITTIPYPDYETMIQAGVKNSKVLQTSDVGLLILDSPVAEVTTFPMLPTVGLADSLAMKTKLEVIGYGVQYQLTPKSHNVNTWVGVIARNSATVELLSTNFQGSDYYLKCTANSAQGKGGIAYGDSGGPVLYHSNGQSTVLGINAYVNNVNCAGVSYHTRIDNPQVLNWINGYL